MQKSAVGQGTNRCKASRSAPVHRTVPRSWRMLWPGGLLLPTRDDNMQSQLLQVCCISAGHFETVT